MAPLSVSCVRNCQTQITVWHWIKVFPAHQTVHQRQRSCPSVRPSVSKSSNFFLDLKCYTNIIRGWILLLSLSVQLAAGVSSLVTEFGGKLHTTKHQKDRKREKTISRHLFTRSLLLMRFDRYKNLTNVLMVCIEQWFFKHINWDVLTVSEDCFTSVINFLKLKAVS